MISIVIPAFNEEENIFPAAEAVCGALKGEEHEIIFVDDGSTDESWSEILRAAEDPNIRGIRFSRNFGKEAAIRAGLEAASGEAAVVMDCDLQHPPAVIPKMIEKWRGGAKVVEGKKSSRGSEKPAHGALAGIFNSLMSRATGFDMTGASDFILLDRRAIDAVLSYGEQGSFFRALSQFVGFRAEEVEYEVAARERGRGKWTFKKLAGYALRNVASFSSLPLYISFFAGGAISLIGLILLILGLCGANLESFTAGISIVIILAGIILAAIGVLGFYVSRIYEEIKGRPKYIISEDTDERNRI